MMMSKQEKIDLFLDQLNDYINIRCEISRETDRCNHSYVVKNLLPQHKKTKELLAETLEELLDNN